MGSREMHEVLSHWEGVINLDPKKTIMNPSGAPIGKTSSVGGGMPVAPVNPATIQSPLDAPVSQASVGTTFGTVAGQTEPLAPATDAPTAPEPMVGVAAEPDTNSGTFETPTQISGTPLMGVGNASMPDADEVTVPEEPQSTVNPMGTASDDQSKI